MDTNTFNPVKSSKMKSSLAILETFSANLNFKTTATAAQRQTCHDSVCRCRTHKEPTAYEQETKSADKHVQHNGCAGGEVGWAVACD